MLASLGNKSFSHISTSPCISSMANSNIISSGSEASDNEESCPLPSKQPKVTRGPRIRGALRTSKGRPPRSRRPLVAQQHTKHYVEHDYHDHARDPSIPIGQSTETVTNQGDDIADDDSTEKKRCGHRGGVAVPFPEKLHYMLSQMEKNETAHIVNWQPHGRCFVVHKPKEFVEDILPK